MATVRLMLYWLRSVPPLKHANPWGNYFDLQNMLEYYNDKIYVKPNKGS